MRLKNTLASLAITGTFALLGTVCAVRARGYVSAPVAVAEVEDDPPPPRVVVVPENRPGSVWIEGRWMWSGGQWQWRDGYYERERTGYIYEQGRWEPRGRGHVWVEGRWREGGDNGRHEGEVRDHRTERREDRREDGPVVRD